MEAWNWSLKGYRENPHVFPYSECFYLCGLVAIFKGAKISDVDSVREVKTAYSSWLIAQRILFDSPITSSLCRTVDLIKIYWLLIFTVRLEKNGVSYALLKAGSMIWGGGRPMKKVARSGIGAGGVN